LWDTDYVDSRFGEDVATGESPPVNAAYAEFHLDLRRGGDIVIAGASYDESGSYLSGVPAYLDHRGCIPSNLQSFLRHAPGAAVPDGGLSIDLRIRTRLSAGAPPTPIVYFIREVLDRPSNNIKLRVFRMTLDTATDTPQPGQDPSQLGDFIVPWAMNGGQRVAPAATIYNYIPVRDHMVNVAAAVRTMIGTPDSGILPGLYKVEVGPTGLDEFCTPIAPGGSAVPCAASAECPEPDLHSCRNGFCSVCGDDSRYDNGPAQTLHVGLVLPPVDSRTCVTHTDCPGRQRCMQPGGREFVGSSTCPEGARCHCYWPDQSRWKFVITHEAGHQVQDRQFGYFNYNYWFPCDAGTSCASQGRLDPVPYYADRPLIDPPNIPNLCGCQHVTAANATHCLQSAETFGGAFVEGWGQFFSAKIWNDAFDGPSPSSTLVYYKEFLDDACHGPAEACFDFAQPGNPTRKKSLPPLAIDLGSSQRWRNSRCAGYPNIGSYATELDVARFLWGIHTAGADRIDMASLFAILRQACSPGTPDPRTLCDYSKVLQWQTVSAGDSAGTRSLRTGALTWFGGSAADPRFRALETQAVNHGITPDLTP
jgi:hypothetical protein